VTGAHLPINAVDAGGEDVNHDLARSGDRIGQVATLQHFRPTKPLDE
jgi:hypothetical protein